MYTILQYVLILTEYGRGMIGVYNSIRLITFTNKHMNIHPLVFVTLVLLAFGIGFLGGRMSMIDLGNIETTTQKSTGSTSESSNSSGTAVSGDALTPGQRQMLTAMGINPNEFTVTPEMVACAEAKLGAARVEEIKNGATPSFGEGVSLVACYK